MQGFLVGFVAGMVIWKLLPVLGGVQGDAGDMLLLSGPRAMAEVGGRRSEVGGRRSEVGGRRSEVGGQSEWVGCDGGDYGAYGKFVFEDVGWRIRQLEERIEVLERMARVDRGLAWPASDFVFLGVNAQGGM
jgi:hypothetical protein